MTDDDRRSRIDEWCRLAALPASEMGPGRLTVVLDDAADLEVEVEVGEGAEPIRIHDQFSVPASDADGLTKDVVESIVLSRSSMIDARVVPPDGVQTVVAIYPDGLTRHSFMTAVFESQKLRDLVRQRVAARAADAVTVAELERLVKASESESSDGEG